MNIFSREQTACYGKMIGTISYFTFLVRYLQHFEVRPAKGHTVKFYEFDGLLAPEVPPQKLRFVRQPNAPPIRNAELKTGIYELLTDCIKELDETWKTTRN